MAAARCIGLNSNADKDDHAIALITTRPDSEIAADLKERMRQALAPVCDLMDEAARAGLALGFQLARNGIGKSVVVSVSVTKDL